MNWLRRKILNFLHPTENGLQEDINTIRGARIRTTGSPDLDNEDCLRFTVHNAQGGKVLQIQHYERKTDRHHTSLYVIASDENFGDSIGKIIFMEMLKKG